MKIMNNTTKFSLQLSFLCISSYMLCMDQQKKTYQDECLHIRKDYEQYVLEQQNNLRNSSTQSFEQTQNQLHQILEQSHEDFISQICNLLVDIQNTHNINTPTKSTYHTKIIDTLYEYQNNLLIPFSGTYHDMTIQKNIRDVLSEKLKINDIHPQRITIRKDNKVPLYDVKSSIPNDIYLKPYLPTIAIDIVINENKFLTLSDIHQNAICACIAEEIAQGAPVIPHFIAGIDPLIQINFEPKLMALQSICKNKLPIFFACLNSPHTAFAMRQLIPDYYNFTKEEYTVVCIINACWKMLEWIDTQKNYNFIISAGTLLRKLSKINGAKSANS
jgi:hypothetical protein